MAAIHEGPEFGVGDFVLLESIDITSFMRNLKTQVSRIIPHLWCIILSRAGMQYIWSYLELKVQTPVDRFTNVLK